MARPPEALRSQFAVSHGVILARAAARRPDADYGAVIRLVNRSHESARVEGAPAPRALPRCSARSSRADVVELELVERGGGRAGARRPGAADATSRCTTRSRSISSRRSRRSIPSRRAMRSRCSRSSRRCRRTRARSSTSRRARAKDELIARSKAEGVEYEERMRAARGGRRTRSRKRSSSHQTFSRVRVALSVGARRTTCGRSRSRATWSSAISASATTCAELSLARSEGLPAALPLAGAQHARRSRCPAAAKTDAVYDVIAFLRAAIAGVDTSLLAGVGEPASRRRPSAARARRGAALRSGAAAAPAHRARARRAALRSCARSPRATTRRRRAGVHADPADPWDARALREPRSRRSLAEYGAIAFTPEARRAHHRRCAARDPRRSRRHAGARATRAATTSGRCMARSTCARSAIPSFRSCG